MFIETAVKNIALNCILQQADSENIQNIYDRVVSGYRNAPITSNENEKKSLQKRKLNLQEKIQSSLSRAYKMENPKVTHFYNNMNYSDVPIWSLFEIITMGDFGFFLSCLNYKTRDELSKTLGLNLASDTNRELVYKYIYILKDLRNAIAHNAVVFDTRFKTAAPSKAMTKCLIFDVGVPYINFKTIGDYVILICYYLKKLHVSKTEIKSFIRDFEKITNEYKAAVSSPVSSMVIHPDLSSRMQTLINFI